jgi:hypothetical protein
MNFKNITSEGPLYELVSRGKKDAYFISDDQSALFPYDNRYKPTPPIIHELRQLPPIQGSEFGRPLEFEFEIAGDVVVEPTLLIQLPTWLPEAQAVLNNSSLITDTAGVRYGYTNGIAYFLFEKIQLYQDRLLIQEWSGDGLFATTRSRGSMNSAFLENALTGHHNGSPLAIQHNGYLPLMRLTLPLVGCQDLNDGGFPRVAAVNQNFRIRCILRKLEDLVEASDGRPKPQPWGRTDFLIKKTQTATPQQFTTLDRLLIPAPTLQLETRHIYTDRTHQDALRNATLIVPFERIYENNFTQGPSDYAAIRRGAGGTSQITRRLDADHPVARMTLAFRKTQALQANQRYNYNADISGGSFYNEFSLIIAGRDRESMWDSMVWSLLEQHAKEERDSGYNLSFVNWSLGDILGRFAPFPRQLEGSVNFTTADRPTLLIDLTNIPDDPALGQPYTVLDVYVESWAALEFERGRSALLFGN